jgi:DNA polymerase-3 subunit gamma/tau
MAFRDNIIGVSVPTNELCEEILRNKKEILTRVAELSGVKGAIELEVTVNEAIKAERPYKPEDRLRYIMDKNPLVAQLRKTLDLEIE